MPTPLIIINFKTYKEASGKNALKLAQQLEKVAKKSSVLIAVDNLDIAQLTKKINLKILSQHIDPVHYGQHTGKIVPEEVKKDGAYGVLINHAEDRLPFPILKKTIERAKEAKLKTFVCSASIHEIKKIIQLKPDAIAFEVPSLIGTGKSISRYKPKSVTTFSNLLKKTKIIPLCGAGISTKEDVESALSLGAKGVLISSAVAKAKNPGEKLKELLL